MHVPDGFVDAPVSIATGVVAVVAVALALHGARRESGERTVVFGGMVAAFVFAVQLVGFPTSAGTDAHVLGGVLAAVLIGPNTGLLCMTVVLLAQSLVLADGGLSTLGTDFVVMDLVPIAVGYSVLVVLRRLLGPRNRGLVASVAAGAALSAPVGAAAFAGLYAVGGSGGIPVHTVAADVMAAHLLVGLVEGAVTALAVGGLLLTRPYLVRAAHVGRRRVLAGAAVSADPDRSDGGPPGRSAAR